MNKRMNGMQLLAAVLFGTCGIVSAAPPVYRYVNCTSCAARIPDSNGTTDGIATAAMNVPANLCSGTTVQAYALQLDAMHSNVGDLLVKLKNPAATTTVTVVNRPLSAGSCKGDDISATFLDTGGTVGCGTSIPALKGDLKSSGVLATFGSALQSGIWLAEVHDQAAGGDGYLTNVQLRLTCGYTDAIFTDSFERP